MLIPVFVIGVIILFSRNGNKISVKVKDYGIGYSKNAINHLKYKANSSNITNYEEGNGSEMYVFSHERTDYQFSNTDYRFIGNNPSNYIYFNCADSNDTSTCELWRIVGVFPLQQENGNIIEKLKIIKNDYIGQYAYDSNGTTDWGQASLMNYLNNEYYNSLSDSAKEMIDSSEFYLSPIGYEKLIPREQFYTRERAYYSGYAYSNYSRTWEGNIALLYPSDYWYGSGWMHMPNQGKMSLLNREEFPQNGNLHYIVNDFGSFSNSEPTVENNIKPVAYLRNDVLLLSGSGLIYDPYVLKSKSEYMSQNFDYTIGDSVYYNNELYHVIDYSTRDSDYVTVLKDAPLTDKYTKIENLDDIGSIPFDYNDRCYYKNRIQKDASGCTNNFEKSYIKDFLNKRSSTEFNDDDLVNVDGNKIRLINQEEFLNAFKIDKQLMDYGTNSFYTYSTTANTPNFIKNRGAGIYCWTMDNYTDSNMNYIFSRNLSFTNIYNQYCVDPVINFRKSSIGNENEYRIGDFIKFNDVDYYVINDSSADIDYVTVIRVDPLSKRQIQNVTGKKINSNSIGYSIYMKYSQNLPISYENSDVRKIVDNWINKTFDDDDLASVNGLKGRPITSDELFENLGYEYQSYSISSSSFYKELNKTDYTPEWAFNYSYWAETSKEDNSSSIFVVTNYGTVYANDMTSLSTVRPVVYLKKSALGKVSSKYNENDEEKSIIDEKIENKCTPKYKKEKITNYNSYNVGDEITYKNEKYYVINNSDKTKNYVTVLKDELLNNREYNDNIKESIKLELTKDYKEYDNTGEIEFYKSDLCNSNDMSDCKKLYNDSIVKKVIDNWVLIELNEDDLVSVDGKKARLLSLDILLSNFGFEEYNETGYYYGKYYPTGDIPGWLYSTSPFWIDSNEGDNNYNYALDNQKYVVWNYAFNKRSIRPVIY